MSKLLRIIILTFLCSCAGITTLEKVDRTKLYNAQFLEKVTLINQLISGSDLAAALGLHAHGERPHELCAN